MGKLDSSTRYFFMFRNGSFRFPWFLVLIPLGPFSHQFDREVGIRYNDTMKPQEFIPRFDTFLVGKNLAFEGVIIGATALNLIGIITRETTDCDVLDPKIPKDILQAAQEFASLEKFPENQLKETWFNNGPESLLRDLSEGWRLRLVEVFRGKALVLHTLGRSDLLRSKLFALCDRGTDLKDCIAMNPTADELKECLAWVCERDMNPGWPDHVRSNFKKLSGRLGYEF